MMEVGGKLFLGKDKILSIRNWEGKENVHQVIVKGRKKTFEQYT